MSDFLKKNLNVPNVLSLIRLLLVPVYIIVFANGHKYVSLVIFLVASFTDFLDGQIARRYNLITDVGKVLDPLADKLMVLTAMFSMTIGNAKIPPVLPWAAVIIVLVKELIFIIGGALLWKNGVVVYARIWGKAAQVAFIIGLISSYFHDWFVKVCSGWFMTPDLILIWIAVALAIISLIGYARVEYQHLKKISKA